MAITYTPTTNFGAKDSLPTNDPDKVIKGSEFTTEFTALQTAFSLAAPNASPTFTGTVTIPTADINSGNIDGTVIGAATPAAATFTSLTATTADINGGNIDGTVIGAATPAAGSFTTGQFSTSLNVDGTVTADGLTVDGGGSNVTVSFAPSSTFSTTVDFTNASSAFQIVSFGSGSASADNFRIRDAGASRLNIAGNGDISFYEDTGTTAKFFWDASAEALGIGTTSPAQSIDTTGNILLRTNGSYVAMRNSSGVDAAVLSMTASDITNVGAVFTGSQLALRAGGSEAMRITSAGNVGIGTTSPASRLEISNANTSADAAGPIFTITNESQSVTAANIALGEIDFVSNDPSTGGTGVGGSLGVFSERPFDGGPANTYLSFSTRSGSTVAEKVRIDSSGNLLVGCTSLPSASVKGSAFLNDANQGRLYVASNNTGARELAYWINPNGIVGTITTNGSSTAYNTSSDYRLKDVDGPITNSGAYIDALKPVQGSWKVDGSRFIGLIAHEVQEVSETQIATGEKDGEEMQGMSYSAPELIANLIAEIQSLRARVAQLEGA